MYGHFDIGVFMLLIETFSQRQDTNMCYAVLVQIKVDVAISRLAKVIPCKSLPICI